MPNPTTEQCKEFTELLGKCWHDIDSGWIGDGYHIMSYEVFYCTKCKQESRHEYDLFNPTYTNPADILMDMREKLGWNQFNRFIVFLDDGHNFNVKNNESFGYIALEYILDPQALIGKGIEYLKQEAT